MTPLTKEALTAVVHDYYDSSSERLYTSEISPRTQRLQALWARKLEDMTTWNDFLHELEHDLPEFIVGDTLSTSDGGPRCMIYQHKDARPPKSHWIIVGCVSLLAPVYAVYGVERSYLENGSRQERVTFNPLPHSMKHPTQVLSRKLETAFGYSAISLETMAAPVPLFVGGKDSSEATLFHALFTSDPDSIP